MHLEQLISPEVYNNLIQELDTRLRSVGKIPKLDLGLRPELMVVKVPFFAELDSSRIDKIVSLLRPRLVLPGEIVIKKGDLGDAMYFISTGALKVDTGDKIVQLGSGEYFGEVALVRETLRNADVMALGYCELLVLSVRQFEKLILTEVDIKESIQQTAMERLNS